MNRIIKIIITIFLLLFINSSNLFADEEKEDNTYYEFLSNNDDGWMVIWKFGFPILPFPIIADIEDGTVFTERYWAKIWTGVEFNYLYNTGKYNYTGPGFGIEADFNYYLFDEYGGNDIITETGLAWLHYVTLYLSWKWFFLTDRDIMISQKKTYDEGIMFEIGLIGGINYYYHKESHFPDDSIEYSRKNPAGLFKFGLRIEYLFFYDFWEKTYFAWAPSFGIFSLDIYIYPFAATVNFPLFYFATELK